MAISDHGVMGGLLEFQKAMHKEGLHSLLGVEAYVTNDSDGQDKDRTRDNNHILLIAKNNNGLKKLFQEVSHAALHNFYYRPRIPLERLKNLSGGDVVCSSACLGGYLARNLVPKFKDDETTVIAYEDEEKKFHVLVDFLENIFGEDFYLEIQDWNNGDNHQDEYNKFLLREGKKRHSQFVITADAHYIEKKDSELHELMMAMQLGMTLQQYRESGTLEYGPWYYLRTPEEMLASSKKWDCEEAFYNTIKIANQCNAFIETGVWFSPSFQLDNIPDRREFEEWKKGFKCESQQNMKENF